MNHSLYSADRSTHLKIVAVALIGASLVAGVGVASRVGESSVAMAAASGPVIKATRAVVVTTLESATIR
jgi:hypothetical protein